MVGPSRSALLALLLAVATVTCVDSHGFLLSPISRNFQSYVYDPMEVKTWNPSEGNGGGVKVVSDNFKLQWPAGKWDLCGDAHNAKKKFFNQFRYIAETYLAGSTIEVHQLITANHAGRITLRVCPHDATSANYQQVCKVLQRADGKGTYWYLPPGQGLDGKKRPLLPAYTDKSFSYYIYRSGDDFDKIPVYVVKYKLPAGFTCEHCILHWSWLTGNRCNPSCVREDPLYPNCDRQRMGFCGSHGTRPDKYPEEFWSCSDIRIMSVNH